MGLFDTSARRVVPVNPLVALGLPTVEMDLARFEPLLAESVVIGDSYLDGVTTHLIRAGGKRLRPLLAIASATGGVTEASQDDLLGGIAIELMHLASLYHDDVMDEATIRRNVDSVNARFGNVVAIVAGDYLHGEVCRDRRRPRHPRRRAARPHARLAHPRTGLRGPHGVRRPTDRRRLPRGDRRQDRHAHGVRLPGRRDHRCAPCGGRRGAERLRPRVRDGVPDPRRPLGRGRVSTGSSASPVARTSARGSTRCPCSQPSRIPTSAVSSARCSASPSTSRSVRRRASSSRRRAASSGARGGRAVGRGRHRGARPDPGSRAARGVRRPRHLAPR